ncbi:4,5-DOPA dioxygenase extradiol [Pseudoxanthomonas spadix]|uniref:4,5-DOPA-extradiol-dioxygenase n=1 Tax=Pseudoxanthomonas spadix TaxID=415229 RepID=UPI001475E986|nr:4,5-DOPA dioxygenase extradiol [Pseudoxanthomonas spadix]MBP3974370.1 4,5-DOPA dioxygenase extradiol [Pseudoxanthomonas spadix]
MSQPPRMPMVFFGHGSPMNALEDSPLTRVWRVLGRELPRPRAILCVSAHWLTRGTAVTSTEAPKTIHDFGAFPQALFDVRYPAPGSPALAARVAELLAPRPVFADPGQWGLDHGTWSVLVHAYPDASVPVVQLSMDAGITPGERFAIGQQLAPLREEGVLMVGTGNVVHNLSRMNWSAVDAPAYPWAQRFHDYIGAAVRQDRPQAVIDFESQGEDARLSAPTPDHFWPLLYVLGARAAGEPVRFENDFIQHASLGMTSMVFGG